jgi:hypothetical protein
MLPQVDAIVEGDWTHCGACLGRFALGVAPVRTDARSKCPHCGTWNRLAIAAAKE